MKKSDKKIAAGLLLFALAVIIICGSIGAMLNATQSGIIVGCILDIIIALKILGFYIINNYLENDD